MRRCMASTCREALVAGHDRRVSDPVRRRGSRPRARPGSAARPSCGSRNPTASRRWRSGLQALGVAWSRTPDGADHPRRSRLGAGRIESAGDHRIAMSFAVAGLIADGTGHGSAIAPMWPPRFRVSSELAATAALSCPRRRIPWHDALRRRRCRPRGYNPRDSVPEPQHAHAESRPRS